jgi:nitrite reductase/ring-hydroxylating ferredoxin subunit
MKVSTSKICICTFDDVEEDEGLRVELPGFPTLAVWRVDDTPFVTDDACTHGAASLSRDGLQEGHVIECGLHLGAFDVRNGNVVSPPCTKPLRAYPTWLDGDKVYADLSVEDDG